MIHIRDSLVMATTKLRTRKVRLFVTIFISSLLFSILAAASFVVSGVFSSIQSFSDEGLGSRYILKGESNVDYNIFSDPTVIDRAIAIHKEDIAQKQAAAKRLGIEYDPNSSPQPIQEFDSPEGKQRNLDFAHPAVIKAIKEYFNDNPKPGLNEFKKQMSAFNPEAYYESRSIEMGAPNSGSLKILVNNKEDFGQQQNYDPFSLGLSSFVNGWSLLSPELLRPFTLDGELHEENGEVIPVVAPFTAVEQLLSLKPLGAKATEAERLARIKEVRAGAANLNFSVCYRNSTSLRDIQTAVSQQQELTSNANNKDYVKPRLMYDVPAEPCGTVRVTRDVRTNEEKQLQDKQYQFNREFGEEVPSQAILKFRVVGVSPDPPQFSAAVASQIIGSIVGSSIGSGWYTPNTVLEREPVVQRLFNNEDAINFGPALRGYYAEMSQASDAERALLEGNCQPDFSFNQQIGPGTYTDPYMECAKSGKPFILSTFGSSSLAVESLKKSFAKVFQVVAIIVVIIAGLIMMGSVGRVIADSRRETAVFRAIGAKRLDIAQIYITYTIFISLLVCVAAVVVGLLVSQYAHSRWADEFTLQALVAYNSSDLSKQFNLYGLPGKELLYILGCALAAGLISSLLPLARNLRRNPIRDMRDEN